MSVLSQELRAWLRPGLVGLLATVDPSGQPETARWFGLRPHDGRDSIEIFLVRGGSEKVLQCVAAGARAALNAIELPSYRSRTFKGWCTPARVAVDADEAVVKENLDAMARALTRVGMPSDALARMVSHAGAPAVWVSLLLEVDSVFDQSPKPGAGARL